MPHSPLTLRGAAVVQAAEAVFVLAATVLAGVDAVTGRSYHVSSGIALTVIGVAAVAALALIALGLARARRWSRTPALLTQLFVGIVGIYLLQGHRLDWGTISVVLAVLGFAALLSPPSMRALTAGELPGQAPPQQSRPGQKQAGGGKGQAKRAGQARAKAGQPKQAGQAKAKASQEKRQGQTPARQPRAGRKQGAS